MGIGLPKPKLRTGDVKARREELLDQDKEDPPPGALWRFRPGQECHELRRLMAQISFGVYLLLNGMANSQISVFSILHGRNRMLWRGRQPRSRWLHSGFVAPVRLGLGVGIPGPQSFRVVGVIVLDHDNREAFVESQRRGSA